MVSELFLVLVGEERRMVRHKVAGKPVFSRHSRKIWLGGYKWGWLDSRRKEEERKILK